MDDVRIEGHDSMVIVDGGLDATLPDGSGGPVLAGPEAVFVAGRVASDASTVIRVESPGNEMDLILAYEGTIETPERQLRVVTAMGDEIAVVEVSHTRTELGIYLSDMEEPDEILIVVRGAARE